MNISKRRPFLSSGIIGILLVAVGLLVNLSGPARSSSLPHGFQTPIIAFEFAKESADILAIFGPTGSAESQQLIRSTIASTRLDFLFLILYGAFLLSFALIAGRQTGEKRYYLAGLLAVVAPLFDVLENRQLLSILQQLINGQTQFELAPLQLFTWIKWGALALAFMLFAPFFRRNGVYGRVVSLFAFAPALLGIAAFFVPGLLNELFALATVLMFLLMIVFSFIYQPPIAQLPSPDS